MDEAVRDLLIVVGVIIAAGIFWLTNGGLEKAKYRAAHPEENRSWLTPRNSGSTITGNGNANGNGGSTATPSTPQNPFLNDKQYAAITDKSPYFKQVRLITSAASNDNPAQEYVELSVDGSVKGRIPISEWKLTSPVSGQGVSDIGKAAVLPRSSVIQFTEEPIRVAAGERVTINTGRSPIGVSFLTNKCIGYYTQFHDFYPSIYSNCPHIDKEAKPKPPNQLNDACLDYIQSWPSCRTPLSAFPENINHYCREYIIKEANYERCVDLHKNDADFFGSTWRVYLRRNEQLWKSRRETIELRDEKGLLVDSVSY